VDFAMIFALIAKRDRAERGFELLAPVWAQLQPALPELIGIGRELAAVLAPGMQAKLAGAAPLAAYDVKWLQASLNALMAEKLALDGDYGDPLRAAVKRYQLARGLFVDGWAGAETVTSIIVEMAKAKVSPAAASAATAAAIAPLPKHGQ
jgi:murein L,D-transpeptidase YcbB/YkuD